MTDDVGTMRNQVSGGSDLSEAAFPPTGAVCALPELLPPQQWAPKASAGPTCVFPNEALSPNLLSGGANAQCQDILEASTQSRV